MVLVIFLPILRYSRFGKFVEIQFDNKGRISRAAIWTYLLERSRVCQILDPERNYHCFYHLCVAATEEREKYKLESCSSFHYLNQSKCYTLDGVDDAEEYLATSRAMDIVGISEKEVIAAILHLGNIEFGKGEELTLLPSRMRSLGSILIMALKRNKKNIPKKRSIGVT